MAIKKISVDQVKIGMYIARIEMSWWNYSNLENGFVIRSKRDIIELLQSDAKYVYIDTQKGFNPYNAIQYRSIDKTEKISNHWSVSIEEREILQDSVPLKDERKIARRLYYKTKGVIKNVFKDVRYGKQIKWNRVYRCIDKMVDSVFRNKDAFIGLLTIKNREEYLYYHSINVCCLCITMGRYLLFNKEDLLSIGIGSLLHDIGKAKIPDEIINKRGILIEQEFPIIKKHPEYSREILKTYDDVNEDILNLVYQHHERFDGRGYPQGLSALAISKFALITAIADVYDAITSDRVYRKAVPVDIAMKKIFKWGKENFAHEYVLKFVRCLGIYPVSTLVELDNREVGIVSSVNHIELGKPKIIKILDSENRHLSKPRIIDLAAGRYRDVKIKRCLNARRIGIDVDYFLSSMNIQ